MASWALCWIVVFQYLRCVKNQLCIHFESRVGPVHHFEWRPFVTWLQPSLPQQRPPTSLRKLELVDPKLDGHYEAEKTTTESKSRLLTCPLVAFPFRPLIHLSCRSFTASVFDEDYDVSRFPVLVPTAVLCPDGVQARTEL